MGRRDALERGETRRLYLSRTPLQAVRCSWQHPGMAKEGTPTQIHAHAGTYTHARAHLRTLRVILPSCGGTDYRAPPPLTATLRRKRACVEKRSIDYWPGDHVHFIWWERMRNKPKTTGMEKLTKCLLSVRDIVLCESMGTSS